MLVQCPDCRVEFHPSMEVCPSCRQWRPPLEETRNFRVHDAADALADGTRPDDLRERLVQSGFSDLEADTILGDARREVRNRNRRQGTHRVLQGIGLIGLGGLGYLLTLGFFIFYGLLAIGLVLFGVGIVQRFFGSTIE